MGILIIEFTVQTDMEMCTAVRTGIFPTHPALDLLSLSARIAELHNSESDARHLPDYHEREGDDYCDVEVHGCIVRCPTDYHL